MLRITARIVVRGAERKILARSGVDGGDKPILRGMLDIPVRAVHDLAFVTDLRGALFSEIPVTGHFYIFLVVSEGGVFLGFVDISSRNVSLHGSKTEHPRVVVVVVLPVGSFDIKFLAQGLDQLVVHSQGLLLALQARGRQWTGFRQQYGI